MLPCKHGPQNKPCILNHLKPPITGRRDGMAGQAKAEGCSTESDGAQHSRAQAYLAGHPAAAYRRFSASFASWQLA